MNWKILRKSWLLKSFKNCFSEILDANLKFAIFDIDGIKLQVKEFNNI